MRVLALVEIDTGARGLGPDVADLANTFVGPRRVQTTRRAATDAGLLSALINVNATAKRTPSDDDLTPRLGVYTEPCGAVAPKTRVQVHASRVNRPALFRETEINAFVNAHAGSVGECVALAANASVRADRIKTLAKLAAHIGRLCALVNVLARAAGLFVVRGKSPAVHAQAACSCTGVETASRRFHALVAAGRVGAGRVLAADRWSFGALVDVLRLLQEEFNSDYWLSNYSSKIYFVTVPQRTG